MISMIFCARGTKGSIAEAVAKIHATEQMLNDERGKAKQEYGDYFNFFDKFS